MRLDMHDVVVLGHRPVFADCRRACGAVMHGFFFAQPLEIRPDRIGAEKLGIAGMEIRKRHGVSSRARVAQPLGGGDGLFDVGHALTLRRCRSGINSAMSPKRTRRYSMFPDRLTQGYRAFLDRRFASERSRYEMLAESGQKPEIMVIGCIDSRVSPEVIFDAAPGELLVVRNVANLVPPYEPDRSTQHGTSAALEFGVQALRVKHIVVLGHAYCGGIRAFADEQKPLSPGDFIGRWMSQIAPAAESLGPRAKNDGDDYLRRLEFASVELSLKNLMTFPCVRILVERGKLHLHGAYFGVASGRLLVRDSESGAFRPVSDRVPGPLAMIQCEEADAVTDG